MKGMNVTKMLFFCAFLWDGSASFQLATNLARRRKVKTTFVAAEAGDTSSDDNKAMAFLRKMGKVGGSVDFTNTVGVDEGPAGKSKGAGGGAKVSESTGLAAERGALPHADPPTVLTRANVIC